MYSDVDVGTFLAFTDVIFPFVAFVSCAFCCQVSTARAPFWTILSQARSCWNFVGRHPYKYVPFIDHDCMRLHFDDLEGYDL